MKKNISCLTSTLALVASVFVAGCSKQEEPAPAATTTPTITANEPPPPPPAEVQDAQNALQNTANAAQQKAAEAGTTITEASKALEPATPPALPTTPAQPHVQGIFDQVKGLIAERKYPEAMAALTQLSKTNLTAEQQNMVVQLRDQIQKAMASQPVQDGLKSVGGLLNPNKSQ